MNSDYIRILRPREIGLFIVFLTSAPWESSDGTDEKGGDDNEGLHVDN